MKGNQCWCAYHRRYEDASKFPLALRKDGGSCNDAINKWSLNEEKGQFWAPQILVHCSYHNRLEKITDFYPNDIQKRKKVACIRSKKIYMWWYDLQKKDAKNHLISRNRKENRKNFLQFLSEIEHLIESGKYSLNNIKGSLHEHFSQNRADMMFCWNHMEYEPKHWFWESQFRSSVAHPKCKSSVLAWQAYVKIQPKGTNGLMTTPKPELRKEFTSKYLPAWEVEHAEEVGILRSKDIVMEKPFISEKEISIPKDETSGSIIPASETQEVVKDVDVSEPNEVVTPQSFCIDDLEDTIRHLHSATEYKICEKDDLIAMRDLEITSLKMQIETLELNYKKAIALVSLQTDKILGMKL